MDIKDLNKTQIVLLTLLVSFVTSIATGIVTVSLMQQASPNFTQVVNRVVERTIEKVVPATVSNAVTSGTKNTVTKETTIVVKEEDLITKSVEQNKAAIVAIRSRAIDAEGLAVNTFIGWGTVLSADGRIATDAAFVADIGTYTILTEDDETFGVKVLRQNETSGVAIVEAVREKGNDASEKYVFTKSKLGDTTMLRLGQTLVAFGGAGRKSVSLGILSGLEEAEESSETASSTALVKKKVVGIEANIVPNGNATGAPLINSFGEVVGLSVRTGLSERSAVYVPISMVSEESGKIK